MIDINVLKNKFEDFYNKNDSKYNYISCIINYEDFLFLSSDRNLFNITTIWEMIRCGVYGWIQGNAVLVSNFANIGEPVFIINHVFLTGHSGSHIKSHKDFIENFNYKNPDYNYNLNALCEFSEHTSEFLEFCKKVKLYSKIYLECQMDTALK